MFSSENLFFKAKVSISALAFTKELLVLRVSISGKFDFLINLSFLSAFKSSEITLKVECRACLNFSLKLETLLLLLIYSWILARDSGNSSPKHL